MINVLVVEDSPVIRALMVDILTADPDIRVAGTANNGEEALEAVERLRPNLITMDVHMPKMNGLDATRRIMQSHPTPIVVVHGSYDASETGGTFRALEAGALAVVPRPAGVGHPEHDESAAELVRTVKLMSEVKVVRRWARAIPSAAPGSVATPTNAEVKPPPTEVKLIAMGASTGGPVALQTILADLPASFPVPILVVQHISPGFLPGFVDWLGRTTKIRINVANQAERVLPGHAYLAPDGFHMQIGAGGKIELTTEGPEAGLRPSVASLFRSVAETFGSHAVGVLLTGMGKDGAEELRLMKEKGSTTIVQDEESSVVYGMPGEAVRLGGATYVLSPIRIAAALTTLTQRREMAQ